MRLIKKLEKKESNKVVSTYIMITVILFVIFLSRFAQVMLFKNVNGEDLTQLVVQLYNRDEVVAAPRGTIYDVSGEIIATDVKTYSVYAVIKDSYPGVKYVKDKSQVATMLSRHISMETQQILELLNQTDVNQTSFGNAGTNLNYAVKEAIEKDLSDFKIEGIYFTEKIARSYPKGYFSNNLIGLAQDTREDTSVPTNSNPLNGIMGIEYAMNTQLKGIDGLVNYDKDAYGFAIPGTQKVIEQVKSGNNIYTTIDSQLNEYLEQLMSTVYEKYQPQALTAMVVRPKTGSVVATSQRPTYNPKTQTYPENAWINQVVERAFEPGSTLKVFTLAAAINEGVFSPLELFKSGSIKVFDRTIKDWNEIGWGNIPQKDGFALSSNVLVVELIAKIGYDKWKSYLDAFGFAQSTQSGLPNEATGLNSYNNEVVKVNTAFGQGISITSFQMMQALTSIATDGTITKLRYIDRIENSETKEVTYTPVEKLSTPISQTTAQAVRKYMEEVVYNPRGTGTQYKIDNFKLALKTGTAEIIDDKTGLYLTGKQNLFSVTGIFPSENPEYIVYLTMDRPKERGTSSHLEEIMVPFAKYAMKYLEKNDESSPVSNIVLPDAVGADIEKARNELKQLGFSDVVVLGDGEKVIKQTPVDNLSYSSDSKIILYTGGNVIMPNIINWSKQDVLKLQELVGLHIEFVDNGFAVSQNIPERTQITENSRLVVQLKFKNTVTATTTESTTTVSTVKESE